MPKWTDYTIKTDPADKDEVMILDTAGKANKRLGLSALSDWILNKLADKTFQKLTTSNKTIIGAINVLNSDKISGNSKVLSKNETWTLNISYNCILMFSPVNDGFFVVIVSSNGYHCVYGENLVSKVSISAVNNVIKITSLTDWPVCFNLIGI